MGSTAWRRFLTKLRLCRFFFFANAFFSLSLSSRAFFGAGTGSGMGMVDRGVVTISFPGCWMSSGGGSQGSIRGSLWLVWRRWRVLLPFERSVAG